MRCDGFVISFLTVTTFNNKRCSLITLWCQNRRHNRRVSEHTVYMENDREETFIWPDFISSVIIVTERFEKRETHAGALKGGK